MNDDLATIEEGFSLIPEEVQSYIYGATFTKAFNTLCVEKNLSQNDRDKLEVALFDYLAQAETEESLLKTISSISPTPEVNQAIITWIITYVTTPIFSLIVNKEAQEEDGDVQESTENQPTSLSAPSPTQALASIKDRLSQNTVIAPTKRDYSVEKTQNTSSAPTIDPYRELPIE
jgi:hypothetical protein